MAGILNKPKKAGERLLLRPGEEAKWEVWAMGDGNKARLIKTCDAPADAGASTQSVLALPLRQLFAVPLWLATTDPSLMREMIFLQLERRGLAAGRTAAEMVFDYRVVASVENKTLVLAVALPGALPAHLCLDLRAYEPSARVLPLPRDQFTLWREDGRLALAVTRGTELAYFQALGGGSASGPVLQELQCIKLQLEAENTAVPAGGVTLWGDFAPAEVSAIGEALGLRVATAPRPAPVLPGGWMDLVPATIRRTQLAAKSRERNFSLVAVAAGAWLLLLLALVVRATWFYIDAGRVGAGLKAHEADVAEIEATASRWNALAPALDPESYPVELLLRCARLLPPDGVRFTSFEMDDGRITIMGEASSAKAASRFAEDLKQSKDLQGYKIDMQRPIILPNGSTTFQIEGVQYGASTH